MHTSLKTHTQDQRWHDPHRSDGGGEERSGSLLYLEEGAHVLAMCHLKNGAWSVGPIRAAVRPRFWVHLLTLIRHLSSLMLFFIPGGGFNAV